MNLGSLVNDWGGFEKLVADLQKSGKITAEHNAILTGDSGVARQIDVAVRAPDVPGRALTIVECKYWKKKVERLYVDALSESMRDLRADRGIIFTTEGFQSGAVEYARHRGIDLFVVRELEAADWGRPGRHF